jgi:hypothetical protein
MMRRKNFGLPTSWLFAAALLLLSGAVSVADEPRSDVRHDQIAAIVAAVRGQEAKYRDIEYVLKITRRGADRHSPDRGLDVTSLETRQVVLEKDRIFLRKNAHERVFATKLHREEVSAYDGKVTRTVVAGNCANIHLRRFEHPDVLPPHALSLAHYHVNFPLSNYLGGTEAIHADPKYPRFLKEGGSDYEFMRAEIQFLREEIIDGLRCAKIRVHSWRHFTEGPAIQYLWLAIDRNHFCIKEQVSGPKTIFGDLILHEMHVDQMREVAPGVWFPVKITVFEYDPQKIRETKEHVVASRVEMTIDNVDLTPHHDDVFFRAVAIPTDLPVFTIKDRRLVGSSAAVPVYGDRKTTKLAEVIARVALEENRYRDLEVNARVEYKLLHSSFPMQGLIAADSREEHSILLEPQAYFTSQQRYTTLGGRQSERHQVEAFDGEWDRTVDQLRRDAADDRVSATLRKAGTERAEGRRDGIPVYRPHVLLLRDGWIFGPLADLLVSPWFDKFKEFRLKFRYCGEEEVDGHPCVKLRGDVTAPQSNEPNRSVVLYLAADRNHIPVKVEHYGSNFDWIETPAVIRRCDDFQEIAPGTWYPFRVTEFAFDNGIPLAQGRILLNSRLDYQIESVKISPTVDRAVFRDVIVPEGTKVQLLDESRNHLGQFEQPKDGFAPITPARYLEMSNQAKRSEDVRAKASELIRKNRSK